MKAETSAEPNVKHAVPFFGVTNVEASVRYYVDGLGFRMVNKWIHEGKLSWCMLQHGSAALMLQEFWRDGERTGRPEGKLGAGVSICFVCQDALAIYREVLSRGIEASRPFVGNGMWVTSVSDPDGYRLDFESYTDAPEESVYSDQQRGDEG
jgi:catechol 2,3-dioxygenase-like lactoylglutathione lyase family enzyme